MKHQPHTHVAPNYESKKKYDTPLNDSKTLDKEVNKFIM